MDEQIAGKSPGAGPLSTQESGLIDRCWRAANCLSEGQVHLLDAPLSSRPLSLAHIKPGLLGHCVTTSGLNLICAHLNRVICAGDLVMDVIDRVSRLGYRPPWLRQRVRHEPIAHKRHVVACGKELPAIREWRLTGQESAS